MFQLVSATVSPRRCKVPCEKLLSEAHVAVVPGEAFGTNEHVRISYATSMKELERGLDRIDRFISGRA